MPLRFNPTSVRRTAWLLVACLSPGCAADTAAGDGERAAAALSSAAAQAKDAGEAGEKPYEVDCNQVEDGKKVCVTDKATYVGWRTFHANCHVCHGQNAVGSTFAPGLLKPIDKERFVNLVKNGYTGQIGVMPGWGENPNVKDFIDELYTYQQARADGVLLPGRPERRKDE